MEIIGHRGARNEAPENTVEGFIFAQQHGCLHFELDIQLSSDNELVVYHDTNLKRTSGLQGKVKHTSYATLKTIDSRQNTPGWHSPCYIPHLQDVLDSVPNTKSWQLEVKSDHRHSLKIIIKRLQELYHKYDLYNHATVTSSNRWILKELRRLSPNIRTGYVAEYRYRRPLKTALSLGCSLLVINDRLLNARLLRKAKQHKLEVSCWTVNDLHRMSKLYEMGVDSVITDIPRKAIEHFSA
jgi:glycerophosphoryl diester phosphodiesterase